MLILLTYDLTIDFFLLQPIFLPNSITNFLKSFCIDNCVTSLSSDLRAQIKIFLLILVFAFSCYCCLKEGVLSQSAECTLSKQNWELWWFSKATLKWNKTTKIVSQNWTCDSLPNKKQKQGAFTEQHEWNLHSSAVIKSVTSSTISCIIFLLRSPLEVFLDLNWH